MNGTFKHFRAVQLLNGQPGQETEETTAEAASHSTTGARFTLTVLLPLYYNPTSDGTREAVETEKLERTEMEIRQRFSGYTRWFVEGWYQNKLTGEESTDHLLRYEIDDLFDQTKLDSLNPWFRVLEMRFRQDVIYVKLSGPITSLQREGDQSGLKSMMTRDSEHIPTNFYEFPAAPSGNP
jgi:hypothetical protein